MIRPFKVYRDGANFNFYNDGAYYRVTRDGVYTNMTSQHIKYYEHETGFKFPKNHYNQWQVKFKDHRDMEIGSSLMTEKAWLKILSHPILAFAYNFESVSKRTDFNPKFTRHDVIRSLDFWIDYFVYQNKVDYVVDGTVDEVYELHLKHLIMTREAVLKLPADTEFTRVEIPMPHGVPKDDKNLDYEWTENVVHRGAQFCYQVRRMTRKQYEEELKKLMEEMPKAVKGMADNMTDMWVTLAGAGERAIMDLQAELARAQGAIITNADIGTSAAITWNKISNSTTDAVFVGNESANPGDLLIYDSVSNTYRKAIPGTDNMSEAIQVKQVSMNSSLPNTNFSSSSDRFIFNGLEVSEPWTTVNPSKVINPINSYPKTFRDMMVREVEVTASQEYTIEYNMFNSQGDEIDFTLTNPIMEGELMNESLRDNVKMHDIKILGSNGIEIDGVRYYVKENITVRDMSG